MAQALGRDDWAIEIGVVSDAHRKVAAGACRRNLDSYVQAVGLLYLRKLRIWLSCWSFRA